MARTDGAQTRNQDLYLEIRRNLLRGSFPAGHRFKLSALCAELGVSVSVAREALTRLAEQGLVALEPNKGFSVPTFTDAEIDDVAFVRKEVESLAVRRSIEKGGIEWEAHVVAAHHQLSVTPNAALDEDPEANELWTSAHRAFHEACAAACGSPRLLAFRTQLYDQSEVIRQMAKLRRGKQRDVAGEHAEIAEAVVARQADRAVQLLHAHIERTRRSCLDAWGAAQT
ncbi:GntR family transcriptional regulator [Streptomyces phyllanthi]|uniref:GntR family transcriptional regulator n=1 Tax=Streptomyces phyllanthi TaxID=1803180 RepID=UPI001883F884|nr:GntR family transcriptional regulator [Streptomyces phyllanthi]